MARPEGHLIATEKLWLTADRERVVPDGHEDAAFLFTTPGKRITAEDAARYGIVGEAIEPDEDSGSGLTITKDTPSEEPEVKEADVHEDKAVDAEDDKAEDAFACPVEGCDFVAKSAGGLTRHQKTHEGE